MADNALPKDERFVNCTNFAEANAWLEERKRGPIVWDNQGTVVAFCDGSHKGSAFSPLKFDAEEAGIVSFCGCKATGKAPRCDGSHKNLP